MKIPILFASVVIPIVIMSSVVFGQSIQVNAAHGQLVGVTIANQRPGFTGTGYVTGFFDPSKKVVLTANVNKPGLYDIVVHYGADSQKGYNITVDGTTLTGMFAPSGNNFATNDAGDVILHSGPNTIEIGGGWGHYDIDGVTLTPTKIAPLFPVPNKTADPDATPAAKALFSYLVHEYGKATFSGQYNPDDNSYVLTTTGKLPAIQGGDFIEYSPSRIAHGSKPNNETEKMIAAAKAGQIITMSWHWNAPTDLIDTKTTDPQGKVIDHSWYKGFYTDSTTFDLAEAINNPGSSDYNLLISDMDTIAVQIKKMSDANVPILWRPLHEAEGGWFWWGAKGPDAYKKLWRLMFDRFTNHDHLHNLIWVYSSGTNPDLYPGDQYVDIVGVDAYPSDLNDTQTSIWKTLQSEYGGRKLTALTEYGGAPDIPDMRKVGVRWSYFVSWSGDLSARKNTPESAKRVYTWPTVINAGDLPGSVR